MKLVKIAALAAAFLAAAAGPAGALSATCVKAKLMVSVTTSGTSKVAFLTCDQDGGTHPEPTAACDLLRGVGGDPAKLNVTPNAICTKEYMPHTVRVMGSWEGRPVWFEKTYSNRCVMTSATGKLSVL